MTLHTEPPKKVAASRWDRKWVGPYIPDHYDLEVLEILFRDGASRSHFLHARTRAKEPYHYQRTKIALQMLHGKPQCLIDRPKIQKRLWWDSGQQEHAHAHQMIYEINQKGIELLLAKGIIVESEYQEWKQTHRSFESKQFPHKVMIGDVLNSIKYGMRDVDGAAFFSSAHIQSKAKDAPSNHFIVPLIKHPDNRSTLTNSRCVPDALFSLKVPRAAELYRLYALEADKGTMPIYFRHLSRSSILRKVLCYRSVVVDEIYKKQFGMNQPLLVLFVTKPERIKNIKAMIREIAGSAKWGRIFKFRSLETLAIDPQPNGDFFTGAWEDIDGVKFYLNK